MSRRALAWFQDGLRIVQSASLGALLSEIVLHGITLQHGISLGSLAAFAILTEWLVQRPERPRD